MQQIVFAFAFVMAAFAQVASAEQLAGNVIGGGGPIVKSSVTLWAADEARLPSSRIRAPMPTAPFAWTLMPERLAGGCFT